MQAQAGKFTEDQHSTLDVCTDTPDVTGRSAVGVHYAEADFTFFIFYFLILKNGLRFGYVRVFGACSAQHPSKLRPPFSGAVRGHPTSQQFAGLRPPSAEDSNTSLPQKCRNTHVCPLRSMRPISNVSAPHSPVSPALGTSYKGRVDISKCTMQGCL